MAVDKEHAVAVLSKILRRNINEKDSITLIAGVGGQRIPIHRVVFTANSKYFTASSGPNLREADENEFILDEIDGPTLKTIVDFCYTGHIDLTEQNATKYLAAASGVKLRRLEQMCSRFFADKLNINTAITTLVIADKYNGHVLRQQAFDFVCKLFDKLPPSHIIELDNRLLEEILKSDTVDAEERVIFERLLCWCRKDDDKRGEQMTDLLKLIRLPLIPSQYLDGETMQMTYRKFGCFEYLNAECERRIVCPPSNDGNLRRRSIYCSSNLYLGDAGARQYGVKIERYISASNEFEVVREIDLGHRIFLGATLYANKMYVFGGQTDYVAQKSVSVFDLTSGEERILPEMASARSHFSWILVGKFIYVFGGRDGETNLSSCERFDSEAETWETLKPMEVARSRAAVLVLNGQICVAGGFDLLLNNLNDVELFDPQNGGWITLSPMQDERARFVICNLKGYLYAMGDRSSIERYDPLMDHWTKVGSCESYECITSSVVVHDSIHVIGKDGEFGEMKIDENGDCSCSFTLPAESESRTNRLWRQLLSCSYGLQMAEVESAPNKTE